VHIHTYIEESMREREKKREVRTYRGKNRKNYYYILCMNDEDEDFIFPIDSQE